MRSLRPLLLAAALAAAAGQAHATADPAVGEWITPDGSTRVTVAPCSAYPARLCGAITWMRRPTDPAGETWRDVRNLDPALRGRPLIGMLTLRDLQNAGPGRWANGWIYDPASGRTLRGRVRALPGDQLMVEGCDVVGCKAQTWRRTI